MCRVSAKHTTSHHNNTSQQHITTTHHASHKRRVGEGSSRRRVERRTDSKDVQRFVCVGHHHCHVDHPDSGVCILHHTRTHYTTRTLHHTHTTPHFRSAHNFTHNLTRRESTNHCRDSVTRRIFWGTSCFCLVRVTYTPPHQHTPPQNTPTQTTTTPTQTITPPQHTNTPTRTTSIYTRWYCASAKRQKSRQNQRDHTSHVEGKMEEAPHELRV